MKKNSLIKGALILTCSGVLTRFMGFLYKIYLSRSMGAESLGLYQLIFPIYGICHTLYAAGIQTAISKLVSENAGRNDMRGAKHVLLTGLLLSVCIALSLSVAVFLGSDIIAARFLLEPRCAPSLRILAIIFPFCGITCCINGYYYGLRRSGVPAVSLVIEQLIRIVCVCIFAKPALGSYAVSCELATLGIVAGEIASHIFNLASLIRLRQKGNIPEYGKNKTTTQKLHGCLEKVFKLSLPLSANKLFLSLLHAFEAILLPYLLRKSGMTGSAALSVLGVVNGMSLSILQFPGALVGSFSVLLLPEISEAVACGNNKKISETVSRTIEFTLWLGILFTALFITFGNSLGSIIFNEPLAGSYLTTLSWLCPFIYLTTVLSSILNGLGKAHLTFLNSVLGSAVHLALLVLLTPRIGIGGYFAAMLTGHLFSTLLDLRCVLLTVRFPFNALVAIVKPGLTAFLQIPLYSALYTYVSASVSIAAIPLLLGMCALFCLSYLIITGKHYIEGLSP